MVANKKLKNVTKLIVSFMFYFGIGVTLTVPLWSEYFYALVGLEQKYNNFMNFMLLISGMCAIYILYNLKSIYKTLDSDPFVEKNTTYLLNMGRVCFVISLIYIVKIFFIPTFATVIIITVFGMAGLFCLTLKDLFSKAVEFKQDSDMTI